MKSGMYRVLLKIESIFLRIKEAIKVKVMLFKDGLSIIHSQFELKNGSANPSTTTQFLLSEISPNFVIKILLLTPTHTKLGGVTRINCQNLQPNNLHWFNSSLDRCLDSSARINLNIMFCHFSQEVTLPLLSMCSYQNQINLLSLSQLQSHNALLQLQNNQLNQELTTWKNNNQQLHFQKIALQQKYCLVQKQHSNYMQKLIYKQNALKQNLQKQKIKIAQIIDIVNQSGNANLIQEIEKIININKDSQIKN